MRQRVIARRGGSAIARMALAAVAMFAITASGADVPLKFRRVVIPVGHGPEMVAAGDLNGDGRVDIVVGNEMDSTITVLLNEGDGHFRSPGGSPFAAGPHPCDLALADYNGDGKLDVAIANHDSPNITILLGDGRGGFVPAPASPLRVDVRPHPHGIAAADFNRDGKLDFVVESWADDQFELFIGDGRGGFAVPGPRFNVGGRRPYERLRAADMNGDGIPDVVTTNWQSTSVSVLLGDGKGGFRQAEGSPFTTAAAPFGVALGDINGDGKPDAVVAHYSGHITDASQDGVSALLNDGAGRLRPANITGLDHGKAPVLVTIGDVDADGKNDIIVSNLGGDITLLLNRGAIFTSQAVAIGAETEAAVVVPQGNGKRPAIAVASYKENTLTVLLPE